MEKTKKTAIVKVFFYALILVSTGVLAADDGQVLIKLGEAKVKKSLMALTALKHLGSAEISPGHQTVAAELNKIISNDINMSGYFQMINPSAFVEDVMTVGLKPKDVQPTDGFSFENWTAINAEFLIRGGYTVIKDQVTLEMYTYQVSGSRLVFAKKYSGSNKSLRKMAHTFTNDLLANLTGKKGMFLSKIVVTSDRGMADFLEDGKRNREVYIMDWDGANAQQVSFHKSITLSPAWSPDGRSIAYTAFAQNTETKKRNTDVFLYNIDTESRRVLSGRQGINSGSAFFPGGKELLLTMSHDGNPDIYKLSIDGAIIKKMTSGPGGAMNVEPAVSPDGKKIVFSSDRSDKPMIYVMNSDGSETKRVTLAGKYNASPAWHPEGNKLAFAGYDKDHFDIFLMNTDGTNLQRLTSAYKSSMKAANCEDPTFSPDGRFIMFVSDRTGAKQLYIISADGTNERRLTSDNANYFKPKWGPDSG